MNTLVFGFYISMVAFVFIKIGFNLDRVSIVSIFSALVSFLFRFANWLVIEWQQPEQYPDYFAMPDSVATFIFMITCYYFCFELRILTIQITASNYD